VTNTFPLFALKGAVAASVLILAGCGDKTGIGEFESGRDAYAEHNYAKAAKLLEKSVSYAPNNVDAQLLLAQAKLAIGDLAAARIAIAKAVELAGDDVDVRMLDAQVSWHVKDYGAAAKGFSALADDASLSTELRSQALAGLGVVEMTRNAYDLARIAFFRAIRLDRRNPAAWYHLGLLYRDGFGYPEAALEQFNIYVRLEPAASPRVQKVQEKLIPELKDLAASAMANRPGVAKRDSAAAAELIAKAEALEKKGTPKDLKLARTRYENALATDPLSYPAALGLARLWPRTDATRNGLQKSLECYKRACTLRPSAVSTFLATGELASRLGHSAVAVEAYSRALAANPASLEAIDGLIRALRKVGGRNLVAQAYQNDRNQLTAKSAKKK